MLDLGGITRVRLGFKVEEFRENEPVVNWPIREVAGCLMLLANETRPDTASSVRAVARYENTSREIHCKTVIDI